MIRIWSTIQPYVTLKAVRGFIAARAASSWTLIGKMAEDMFTNLRRESRVVRCFTVEI